MNTQVENTIVTNSEASAPVEATAQAWNGDTVPISVGVAPKASTVVENAALEESAAAPAETDEVAILEKLTELRQLHFDNMAADDKDKKAFAQSTQARLRGFLVAAFPQAEELNRPKNRDLLRKLLRQHDMNMGPSDSTRFAQIANMQMGNRDNKDGVWRTPSRRNERVGLLYRIFHERRWAPSDLDQAIINAKGTTKLIDQDKRDRADPEIEKVATRRATTVRAHTADTVLVPVPGISVKNAGEWRLALVSIHDGGLRVRNLVGKRDDAATQKERDKFCAEEIVHLGKEMLTGNAPSA